MEQMKTLTIGGKTYDVVDAAAVKTINGATPDENGAIELKIESAVEVDATLTQEGKAADAKATGERLSELSEEIAELPNHIAQDVVDVLSKFDEEGDFVTITPKAGTVINVVSTFEGQTLSDGYIIGNLLIFQAHSANLFDAVGAFGGAGKTVTKNGVTCTINDDGTCTLNGAWEGSDGFLLEDTKSGVYGEWRFPAGVYTTDRHIAFRPKDMSNVGLGNRWGGVQDVGSDFRFDMFGIHINAGEVFENEKVSLAFVRGTTLPEADHKFIGSATIVSMSGNKKIGDGSIDWNTGVIRDADGNEVETLASTVLPDLTATGETVTMWVGNGTIHVTGEKAGISASSTNAEEAFDPTVWGLPVLKLNGDTGTMTKDTSVDLQYAYGSLSGTCSVKWQGSSSLSYLKKNYTIKFDNAFEAKDGWGAQKKYCFKANWIDATHARNVVSARLWGQVIASRATKDEYLAACPNYGAVDGFPCIIMLNGEFHGLYTWNIPKDGWMMNFPTDGASQQCILCANGTGTYNSELFKAEEGAFGEGFDLEYITDEDNTGWALTSLNNLIRACAASNGSDLDTTITPMLDWDSVIDYLCFSAPIGNFDGISKNYLLYTRDGVKWHMGAYDLDCPFGNWPNGTKIIPANGYPMLYSYTLNHKLFELVTKYKKDQFKARYQELRNSVLSEDNIATEFANFIGGIPDVVFTEEHKKWPGLPLTSVNGLWLITDWYRRKVAVIDAAVNAL